MMYISCFYLLTFPCNRSENFRCGWLHACNDHGCGPACSGTHGRPWGGQHLSASLVPVAERGSETGKCDRNSIFLASFGLPSVPFCSATLNFQSVKVNEMRENGRLIELGQSSARLAHRPGVQPGCPAAAVAWEKPPFELSTFSFGGHAGTVTGCCYRSI